MSNPAKPGWPDASMLPFTLFGAPTAAPAATQPLAQGLAGGMDLLRNFWGNLPGASAVPGFLVPTLDVEELDKRISDLRAAESWLSVNLNMLRATVQGLEVQRNTIAALQSMAAMTESAAPPPETGLPKGWPSPAPVATPPVAAAHPEPVEPQSASAAGDEAAPAAASPLLAGLAASNWLGFMQDQFSKVAQAALATSSTPEAAGPASTIRRKAAAPAKKAARRRAAPRKAAGPR